MKQAFTLIELAIVLIILGLLAGGVLYGQNLIRAAELRGVVSEFESFRAATLTFRNKYFYLPGDMPNAEDFWGTMSTGTCPNATAGVDTETCNGDGDGEIRSANAAGQTGERFTFWQHLTNASLIPGRYTGIAGTANGDHVIVEENSPRSKVSNAGWTSTIRIPTANHFSLEYGNTLMFGGQSTTGSTFEPILTPEEAWNVDSKIDDGLPVYGIATPMIWGGDCTTATSATDLDSEYNVTNTDINCILVFRNLW